MQDSRESVHGVQLIQKFEETRKAFFDDMQARVTRQHFLAFAFNTINMYFGIGADDDLSVLHGSILVNSPAYNLTPASMRLTR